MASSGAPLEPRTSTRSNVQAGLLGAVVSTSAALVSFPILARGLGIEARGRFALILAVSEIGTNLFRFGVPEAVALFDKERIASGRSIYGSARRLSYILLLLSLPMALLMYHTLLQPLPSNERILAATLVAWSPVFDTLGIARSRFLVTRSDALGMAVAASVAPVVSAVGFGCLLLLGNLTVISSVLVTVAALAVSYSISMIRIPLGDEGGTAPFGAFLGLASRGAPYSAMEAVNLRLDQAIIPSMVGTEMLGSYSVASSLTNPLARFGTLLSGSFYSDVRINSLDSGRAAAARALRRSGAVLVIATGAMMFVAPIFIKVLAGPDYASALPIVMILLPATGMLAMSIVLANLLGALGRQALASWSQAGGLVVTLALLVPAILWKGGIGAAVVSLLSYSVRAGFGYWYLHRLGVAKVLPRTKDFVWALKVVLPAHGQDFE
jgi:O-antigen/teichoic acid export membrane protein